MWWPGPGRWAEQHGYTHGNASGRWSPVATHPHWLAYPAAPPELMRLLGALLLVVGAAGSLGNALVLAAFTRCRRLRGPFSAFVVNLALADFSTSLLHGMVAASCFRGRWVFGAVGCTVYAFGVGYFGLLSIVTLAAIAVERYLVITAKPFSASWRLSRGGARKVCACAWLYCLLLCAPPLLGWSAYVPEGFLTSCSWDYLSRSAANRAFYLYLLALGFLIPVAAIACCYARILAAVLAHAREMRRRLDKGGPDGGGGAGPGAGPGPGARSAAGRSALRTAQIILALVLLFLLAWAPYAVVTAVAQFGDERLVNPWVATLPAFFAKASVVYNPIVYGLSHPYFRASLKRYLSACVHAVFPGTVRGPAARAPRPQPLCSQRHPAAAPAEPQLPDGPGTGPASAHASPTSPRALPAIACPALGSRSGKGEGEGGGGAG